MKWIFIFLLFLAYPIYGQTSGAVLLSPSGSQAVTQPAGTSLGVNSLNGCVYVGPGFPTVASAITAVGPTGCVVIPAGASPTDLNTYSNPNNVFIINSIFGSPASPSGGLSYDRNNLFLWRSDNTTGGTGRTCCSGQAPAGVGDAAPMVGLHLDAYGSRTVLPLYSINDWKAGATGYEAGFSLNAKADLGSSPAQIFNNILLDDESGWDIGSCTLNSGTDTCSTTNAIISGTMAVGYGVLVNGNSVANTGKSIGIVTAFSANSITFTNANQGASGGPVTGGHIGPNHLAWVLETNGFNNNHDPGPVTPISGQNVPPFHGITSTSNGIYPLSEGFYANGPIYEGFLCGDASDACFVAGYPQPSGGTLAMQAGFVARPKCVATSGLNCGSVTYQLTDSVYDASTSYREYGFLINYNPISNVADAAGHLQFTTVNATGYLSDQLNFSLPSGSATAPTYGFTASQDGVFVDSGGAVGTAVNGVETFSVTSSGVRTGFYQPTVATAPTGICTAFSNGTIVPSLDGHMTSCSAGTWTLRW